MITCMIMLCLTSSYDTKFTAYISDDPCQKLETPEKHTGSIEGLAAHADKHAGSTIKHVHELASCTVRAFRQPINRESH